MKMKKTSIIVLCLAAAVAASANVTINLGSGFLYGADGSTLFPDNGLLQLVASSTDTTFNSVTAGSFTSGDDVVLASFAFDHSTTSTPGFSIASLDLAYTAPVGQGDAIALRWFPTLTLASPAPLAGTIYGQFRTDAILSGSDIAWVLPSDGAIVTLNFGTIALGGESPDNLAVANLVVTAVPEPATYAAILGFVTLGLVGYRRFRRR
jgi:hypothetical protein